MNLIAHHLRVDLIAETPIELDEHPGSSFRGMLFNALRGPGRNPALGFCMQRHLKLCADCALVETCPVAALVATLNPESDRGRDVPRPFALVPPGPDHLHFRPGETLTFGLTIFGNALSYFPYLVMGLHQAGPYGVGKRRPQETAGGKPCRGRFRLDAVHAVNLISGEMAPVLIPESRMVHQPSLPVSHAQMEAAARAMLGLPLRHSANGHQGDPFQRGEVSGPVRVAVEFLTPTRIIKKGHLDKSARFTPLFHRLLERLLALDRQYSGEVVPALEKRQAGDGLPVEEERAWKNELLALADTVELVDRQTRWVEVWSYSSRQARQTPIGGLVGRAVYQADRSVWARLLPFLLWGTVVQVGKNAVKGSGRIAVQCEG